MHQYRKGGSDIIKKVSDIRPCNKTDRNWIQKTNVFLDWKYLHIKRLKKTIRKVILLLIYSDLYL